MNYDNTRSLYTNLVSTLGSADDIRMAKVMIGAGARHMVAPVNCGTGCINSYDLFPVKGGTVLLRLLKQSGPNYGNVTSQHLIAGFSKHSIEEIQSSMECGGSLEDVFSDFHTFEKDDDAPAVYVLNVLEALSNYLGGGFKASQW